MPEILHETFIEAPIEHCFDLARSIDVHMVTLAKTNELAIDGTTSGLMELGDWVTWEATHLGVRQKLTSKITEMDRPHRFSDEMVKGAFHSFTHTHEFTADRGGTIMKERFSYRSPYGIIGKLADKLFLERYMTRFVMNRASELKRIAEAQSSAK
ncbi:SRPBCC family protein [Planococcus sp. ISL-109]|uniref:SRPBCC family protein n=1 Tax=Planococcus sp. ISL-109 TaxID=2819166 RepID=UPI001BE9935C|nr:SRPBCC family protein [Planococcus sp. ISL-109]MBT2581277.1 SRPBCC family protein [Planococcus sp. ISL-109]